tara:strand:- start:842 stop:1261 length:420 start_codon:yes stop_codon:yes gene_type:complete
MVSITKNKINKIIDVKSIGKNILSSGHSNGTPSRKPRNNGGSPSGESEPPMFATKKIKKIIIWVLFFLHRFDLIRGLIKSIADPVVPMNDARDVPISKIDVFVVGLPAKLPEILIPPEIIYRAVNRAIKGTNSPRKVCK